MERSERSEDHNQGALVEEFQKSTGSVEADPALTGPLRPGWRKSTYSNCQGCCVEVAPISPRVGVRDSDPRRPGTMVFGGPAWHGFLSAVRARTTGTGPS
ncbi:DUF397 domain-containing protein [Embleya sp. NPDC056538]